MSTTLLLAALDYEGDLIGSEKLVLIILCNRSNDGKSLLGFLRGLYSVYELDITLNPQGFTLSPWGGI